MGGGTAQTALRFLVEMLFGIYILVVMLRFLFQLVRADFYNPISQAIVLVTTPPLRFLRRWLPPFGPIDTSSVVLMLVIQLVESAIVQSLLGRALTFAGLLVLAIAELLDLARYIFFIALIVMVILSWFAPGMRSPAVDLVDSLVRPLLRPLRRVVPPLGPLDLSPLIAIILLQLAAILVIMPLKAAGIGMRAL